MSIRAESPEQTREQLQQEVDEARAATRAARKLVLQLLGDNEFSTLTLRGGIRELGRRLEREQELSENLREELVDAWLVDAFGDRPLHQILSMSEGEYERWGVEGPALRAGSRAAAQALLTRD